MNAIKNKKETAQPEDFEFAIDRVSMGLGRKNLLVKDKDKLSTAYHEGGHALTALLTKDANELRKLTILPRGPALGYTSFSQNDELSYTRA